MNVLRRSVRRGVGRTRRAAGRVLAPVVALVLALPLMAALAQPATAAAPDDGILKVLLFYKTQFHASNVQARQAVNELAADLGTQYSQTVEIQETDQAGAFTTENLATTDVVVFAQTGGVLFDTNQRAALEAYIRGGGGYMGLHYAGWSVGQSEHDVNPFYLRLVGAMSEGHPENPAVRPGRIEVRDTGHPLTQGLPESHTRSDEWYDWTLNPAPNVRTLVEADETSYGMGRQGSTHPVTWCQQIDAGRSWYTGMGHEGTAYSEPYMRTQMRLGLAYSAGLLPADCSPPAKDTEGSWSGVTPWPLVPINMSLTPDGTVQSFGSVPTTCNDATKYDWTGNGCVSQGGQFEYDVWDPAEPRTLENVNDGLKANTTYTDLFCSMQVFNSHTGATMTVGGDDGLGENAPNDAALGVTSYKGNRGIRDEAPMNYPRWYPTGSTMPNGDIVVQGGSLRGGPGGPGVLTPEIYSPDAGSGWKLLTGATSAAAYGDGGNGNGPDENRWWYPRAFVAPGSGNLFNISGTQMFELDPYGNDGDGEMTLRGTLPAGIANQGGLGNPVGATSTAVMYEPGKILQVGGGWWANGGGPDGARAGFTVDITGGTANPVIEATEPMEFARHWPTATVLPDGKVLVTGGSRVNNGNGGYVTDAEVWDPETGEWTTLEVPHEHARLYHSSALLLPDGRVMIGGGGAPGPRNYTDVEYYSPSYLYDGQELADRPEIATAPRKIGYDGTFDLGVSGDVSRVTLVRNGSVTHGFNNDQGFQDLTFTQDGDSLTVDAPADSTYAVPGAYMVFVFDADGTPSVGEIVRVDPEVEMDARSPELVEQFEFPKQPADWRGGNPANVIDVPAGGGRMAPWAVDSDVQLVRGIAASQGALGALGYHLALGQSGAVERTVRGLEPGRDYRISLRLARDSRSAAGSGDAVAGLSIGSLDTELSTATSSQGNGQTQVFDTFVDTFTATSTSETLRFEAPGTGAGMMIDNLVIIGSDPGVDDVPVHYEFEEGEGTSAANTGTDDSVGAATLTGTTGWSDEGVLGGALDLPGGGNGNAVDLPDNLLQGEDDFTTSFWVRPDTKANWIGLFHLGSGLGGDGSFFQIQMQTDAAPGGTGLAATFKAKGSADQERVYAVPTQDVVAGEWNHVVFTREGSTGTLYLDGVEVASRDDLTIDMTDVGPTENNWLGRNGYPDPAYDGRMDDVRIYDTTLTPESIAALHDEGAALRTTTSVTTTPTSPSPFEEPVTVSASVEDEAAAAAEGQAELWIDGARVGEPQDLVDGAVTFDERVLAPGDHDVRVVFVPAAGWRGSEATTTHTVERPPPGVGVPIHYRFDEGSGGTAANSGTDSSVGDATLGGTTGWSPDGKFGTAVNLPGGGGGSGNQVALPDNIDAGLTDQFTVSLWVRPDALPTWVPHVQIGSSTDTFFLLQSNTQTAGATGFAATFKSPGNGSQERLVLGAGNDVPLNQWTHVVFTMSGSTGKIYFDGELVGERDDFTFDLGDVGVDGQTTANMIGGTSWPDGRFDGLVDDFRIYGYELSDEQVVELFETVPNTAPVAEDDTFSTDEDEVLEVEAPGVLDNDTDAESDELTATDASEPEHGEVVLAADGSFTYTPDAGFHGTDTFTYTASDGTAASEPATVTVEVAEVADAVTLEATASRFTYGKEGSVVVTVDPATATGDVEVLDGDTVLGSAELTDGEAVVTLPAKSLRPGTHELTVSYAGSASYEPASTTVGVKVTKVKPRMVVKAPKKVERGDRAKVRVVLGAPDGVKVAGKVRAKLGKKSVTVKVRGGKAVLRLPKATGTGRKKVTVTYLGSPLAQKVVKRKTIRVTR